MKRTGFVSRRRTQPNQQRRRQPLARWIPSELMALTLGSPRFEWGKGRKCLIL
jgi:hypothetical protein